MADSPSLPEVSIPGLHATSPAVLPFAPTSVVRAFLLERNHGNLLLYSTGRLEEDAPRLEAWGGVAHQYLNHWHEAMFGLAPASLSATLIHHEAESGPLARYGGPGQAFSERHRADDDFEVIPIPGHTPGATAYLWETGGRRLLFTGDSVYLHKGNWRVGLLESSDREAYLRSLQLIRDLEFDVLVPWVVDAGDPYLVSVDAAERRSRIDQLITWVERAGSGPADSGSRPDGSGGERNGSTPTDDHP